MKSDVQWIEHVWECPVYRPSHQDFADPFTLLHKLASQASKHGICKIVSPVHCLVPAEAVLTEERKGFTFETTVQSQPDSTTPSVFTRGRNCTFAEFESTANKAFPRLRGRSVSVEHEFWSRKKRGRVEYGINVEGTAFSSHPRDPLALSPWNLQRLSRLPNSTLRFLEHPIPGITDPMLYIGMIFSMFAWHVEDHYLYSINYHHCGAPKTWYCVPSEFAQKLEKVVAEHVYRDDGEDRAFKRLAEKTSMFSPKLLIDNHIPVYKAVQNPGEFVITFPKAYHAGFSHGFNCGEAVNFAMNDWFEFGEEATHRYARLGIVPVVPLEQLLCKHALHLHRNTKQVEDGEDVHAKSCFVRLVKYYEKALLQLRQRLTSKGEQVSSAVEGTVICWKCKRGCYLAYVSCRGCHAYAVCLDHVWDTEVETCCCCGTRLSLVVRDDMSTYTLAARHFQHPITTTIPIQAKL